MEKVPARQWVKEGQGAKCLLCPFTCRLNLNNRGRCGVRVFSEGQVWTLNYGYTGAIALDPVEKKPFYHFWPGSQTFSVGTPGCNFTCLGCQNHSLSQVAANWPGVGHSSPRLAEVLVMEALSEGASSLAYTYNEPTVFYEYAQDLAERGHDKGLPSLWVTNGFFTAETLDRLIHVEAFNVDLKGFQEDFYHKVSGGSLKPVLKTLEKIVALGRWLEVTTLLIPGLNDSPAELKALAKWLADLSVDIPWHISRFIPRYKQMDRSTTPVESMERAKEIGLESGLRYVYIGNAQGPGYGDTVCPNCQKVLIKRSGFWVDENLLGKEGECPGCGAKIAGRWRS
ncbi:MAG: AmmeMemoRadiSam system radical SAM enzyme [Deltaproteobacteria bacterium]|nr:AmmeMemoRadiSam system radical SAM enzyme [Deltaproteobacteria bacterium]